MVDNVFELNEVLLTVVRSKEPDLRKSSRAKEKNLDVTVISGNQYPWRDAFGAELQVKFLNRSNHLCEK